MKLALRGITSCASGDAGSPGRTNEEYELFCNLINCSSWISPWILSVGATFVKESNKSYNFKTPLCRNNVRLDSQSINFNQIWLDYWSWIWNLFNGEKAKWQKSFVEKYLNSKVSLPNKKNWNVNGEVSRYH